MHKNTPQKTNAVRHLKFTATRLKKAGILVLLGALCLAPAVKLMAQPYFETYVDDPFVKENAFLKCDADTSTPPAFASIKDKLPQPVWPARPDVIKCYWFAWQTAFGNLHAVTASNGFVAPYIDPAFNGHIFMWDSSFMTLFGKYGDRAFDFQGTLDNFYRKQHPDGFICREIRESDGSDCFARFNPSSTGPNILPWSEWSYYLNSGDESRLRKVFPALLAYYQWFHDYRSWKDGSYFATGWSCGMDNQPRVPAGYHAMWSPAHMAWVDATLQQIFAGKTLIKMAEQLHRTNDVKEVQKEVAHLTHYVNDLMWNNQTAFYYDRHQDGSLSNVKSIAAYWALLAQVVPKANLPRFLAHLENTNEFCRLHRVPTLSADSPGFDPNGGYWCGSAWAPTTYMVLCGLNRYGKDTLAHEIAVNDVDNVVKVFTQTGTLWENYSPDKAQGNDTRNFVGWTGLIPISELFEYVFGLRPDVPHNTLVWDVRLTEEHGVKQYPFGTKGLIDLICQKREKTTDTPSISVKSNMAFDLTVIWAGGEKTLKIHPGEQNVNP